MSQQRFCITVIAIILGCLVAAAGALAQDNQQTATIDDNAIEEIVVTGTRIKRRDFDTASPLTTISKENIAFSGQATIEETLNRMPQVMPSYGRASNNPGTGTAEINLRGLGPGRSLVLLNGRRMAPSGTGSAVDVNTIPQALIQRVEIVTGGTSTVYGSDAIAGAVNFITKDNYSGFGVEAGMSMAEPGDAETYDLSFSYGHNLANGMGNITLYANMVERKSLLAADREFTRIAYWDDGEGNLIAGGVNATAAGTILFPGADLGNGPVQVIFNPDGTLREYVWADDAYNYAPPNYLQIPMRRLALGVMGTYDLTDKFEAYLEASHSRNEPAMNLAPVPGTLIAQINLDNPLLTSETRQIFVDNYSCGPNLACIYIAKRFVELGPRLIDYERDYSRIVAGFRGELWKGWDIDVWITYTTQSSVETLHNTASRTRYLQGLLVDPVSNECTDPTGGCVPLDIFGEGNLSAEGAAFIRFEDLQNDTDRTNKLVSMFVTGSPFDTWAGSMDMAVGLEWRSDEAFFEADEALFTRDAMSFNGESTVSGSDEVFEIYSEFVVPLASDRIWAKYLGLEVGARYSDYKHAGGMWTYKAGGEWLPLEGLRFRTMYQRSARAPNSGELFEEQRTATRTAIRFDSGEDLCSASEDPVGNGFAEICILQGLAPEQLGIFEADVQYPVDWVYGGNPNLVPEVGETWTVGAVISPETLSSWLFTVDYFELEVTDTIGEIDANQICLDPLNVAHLFCENLQRDDSGNIAKITQLTSNRGLLKTTGVDIQLQYVADLPESFVIGDQPGELTVNLYWTHMISHKDQENPVTEILECAGYFGFPCWGQNWMSTFSKDRVTSNIHYASGPLGVHLTWRWIEGTVNAATLTADESDPKPAIMDVGNEHYLDLGLVYEFGEHFAARIGVNNLLDNDPPQMADAVFSNNTDEGMYDVFGRSYYLNLSAQF